MATESSVGRGWKLPSRALAVLVSLALVGALVAIGLTGGEDGSPAPSSGVKRDEGGKPQDGRTTVAARQGVVVQLAATAEVWVCLLDSTEEPLIDGEILETGAEAGPFRADGFTIAFGNGEVELTIDGKQVDTPPSASPVGYEIDSGGDLSTLEEGERPDCE